MSVAWRDYFEGDVGRAGYEAGGFSKRLQPGGGYEREIRDEYVVVIGRQ